MMKVINCDGGYITIGRIQGHEVITACVGGGVYAADSVAGARRLIMMHKRG